MNSHPFLRAYLAGIAVPNVFLLLAMTVFAVARYGLNMPIALERAMVFPMAVVPNLWGLWNMLYVASTRGWTIGVHGALLPAVLIPAGFLLARLFELSFVTPERVLLFAPVAFILYYLVWKHLVGFLNELLGIAG